MPRLEILSGKRKGDVIDLVKDKLDVGNKKTAAISIRDPWVSFKHGCVGFENGRYYVEDLGSTNGTWINGKKIEPHNRQTLKHGDTVYFGKTKTRYRGEGGARRVTSAEVKTLKEERDELLRVKDVLERFLDVPKDQRSAILAKVKRPEAIVDNEAVDKEKARAEELEGKVKALREEKEEAEKARLKAQRDLEDLQGSVKDFEQQVLSLQGQVTNLQEQSQASVAASKGEMEKQQALEAQIRELENHKAELERKLEEAELEVKQKTEALAALEAEKSSASGADPAQLEVEIKHLNEKLSQREQTIEELTQDMTNQQKTLEARNDELENKLLQAETSIATQEHRIQDLEGKLNTEVESATSLLQKEIRTKTRAFEDAQRLQKAAEERVHELETQLDMLRAQGAEAGMDAGMVDNSALQQELEEAKATIATLQSAAASGDVESSKIAAIQLELDQLRQERDKAVQARDVAVKDMQETREEIDKISMESIELEEELEQAQEELKKLKGG